MSRTARIFFVLAVSSMFSVPARADVCDTIQGCTALRNQIQNASRRSNGNAASLSNLGPWTLSPPEGHRNAQISMIPSNAFTVARAADGSFIVRLTNPANLFVTNFGTYDLRAIGASIGSAEASEGLGRSECHEYATFTSSGGTNVNLSNIPTSFRSFSVSPAGAAHFGALNANGTGVEILRTPGFESAAITVTLHRTATDGTSLGGINAQTTTPCASQVISQEPVDHAPVASPVASSVPSRGAMSALSTSFRRSCVIASTGELRCVQELTQTRAPEVPGGLRAQEVAGSSDNYATCILTDLGSLRCFESSSDARILQYPREIRQAHGLVVGSIFGCVILADQAVRCWGSSINGFSAYLNVPANLRAIALTAGQTHACAIRPDRSVVCWGGLGTRNLDPDQRQFNTRVLTVPANLRATAISAGSEHTCAIDENQGVVCWGYRGPISHSAEVLNPPSGIQATAIASGGDASCAIQQDQTVICWGILSSPDGHYPIPQPPSNQRAVAVSVASDHACVTYDTGVVSCWSSSGSTTLNGVQARTR